MDHFRYSVASTLIVLYLSTLGTAYPSILCRCMPTDSCWPSSDEWAIFNKSIGGKLVATAPLALPCHEPDYNSTVCTYLQSQWTHPELQ